MAQTKSQSKKRSAPKRAKSSSKPKASKAAKPKATRRKSRSSSNGAHANGSAGKGSATETVRHAVGDVGGKAKDAGKTVGKAASKAKIPLVAGGAAIAGAAGGMALAASKRGRKSSIAGAVARRPKIKIDSGDVAKAAKEVGNFSAQVGEIANELQRARESADGKHRSPVEVVLQGLTARR
ncbi:MAG TPA: hypothetical protein VK480_09410 [Solirubrobacterales bacterium]|nr:hypothetical protein [Solirubrobacterales bacterium]